ncbi:hypothetical protein [Aurantiacibacter suaedae]|uniref:hypothetical protein n=1 Tax=Aurantiacibacter suaedae TaxID=2545755 RepID=UPI001884009D|nr:hypothetical protein [Aurantiacibacter suaedae]
MTQAASKSKLPWIVAILLVLVGAIAVLFVLPAETGYDPTGVGKKMGLTEIADPVGDETLRGNERMEKQEVLVLSNSAPAPLDGVSDVWEYELAPFESVEFKYTIPEGEKVAFRWEGTGELHYDMHAHPFDGGTELTESYGIGDAKAMQGTYLPAFSGIHGWFWENRSLDNVTLRLEASGGMTNSTIFAANAEIERPLEGAEASPEGTVAGHELQAESGGQ